MRELIDNFSFININKINLFSYWLLHSSNSVMLVFFSFSYLILVIKNVAKSQGEKKIQKPGETTQVDASRIRIRWDPAGNAVYSR